MEDDRRVIIVSEQEYSLYQKLGMKMDGYLVDTDVKVSELEGKHQTLAKRLIKRGNLVKGKR